MKNYQLLSISIIFIFIFIFIALGHSPAIYAHDMDGTLGPDSSASDYYQVNCSDDGSGAGDAKYLEIELLTTTKAPPVVSLQIRTDKPVTVFNITDPDNGNNNPSRTVKASNVQLDNTGNGFYFISVNKDRYGIQSYHFTYHCISAGNDHTGTEITTLQNQ